MWGVGVLWLNVELKRSYVGHSGIVVKTSISIERTRAI